MADEKPMLWPTPMSAMPTVAVVAHEDPVAKLTMAQTTTVAGKKMLGESKSKP